MFIKKNTFHYCPVLLMCMSCWSYGYTQDIPLNVHGSFVAAAKPCSLPGGKNSIDLNADFGIVDLKSMGDKVETSLGFSLLCDYETTATLAFSSPSVPVPNLKESYYKTSSDGYGVRVTLDGELFYLGKH